MTISNKLAFIKQELELLNGGYRYDLFCHLVARPISYFLLAFALTTGIGCGLVATVKLSSATVTITKKAPQP